ncbi:MAG: hypothetical protein MJZ64_08045, partial [Paludibacteraceae bacterium]|nr:hypothetical protein [Paludibacteraceae bacterium]
DGEGKNVWNQTANYELCDTMYFGEWTEDGLFTLTCEAPKPVETKYYAKNNWNGAEDWTWLEMTRDTVKETLYTLGKVVFGGTGININTKEEDTDAFWFDAKDIPVTVADTYCTVTKVHPWFPGRELRRAVAAEEEPMTYKLLAGDTIKLFFNAADTTIQAGLLGRPAQPEPAKTFDLTIVQDSLWSKDGGKVAAWIWGDDLEGQWTEWATNNNDTLTLKVNEKADSIIFVRCAPEATEPTWEPWNRIDAEKIAECHLFIITDWNEGVWCERPQPVEDKFYVTGNDALVGAEKAWQADAIEMVDYTYTFPMLAAGEYQLKVTDGTWEHAWGYDNLSPTVAIEGLYTDVDGNICFTVYTPNDVTVTFAQGYVVVTGDFKNPTPATPDFGLLVNGTDYLPGTPEDKGEYTEYVVNTQLAIGEFVQLYDNVNKAAWTVTPEGSGFTDFEMKNDAYYIKQAGSYQFYIKIPKEGMNSGLYVGYQSTPTDWQEIMQSIQMRKFIMNHRMYIKKGDRLFDLQGQWVR